MVLWSLNPEIYTYFPTELTEPIFLFGLVCWTWAMVRLMQAPSKTLIGMAAFGLSITLLSRPVLQLLAPLGLIASLVIWRACAKSSFATAQAAQGIALSLALGMLIPMSLLIKNGLVFGLWGLGTGSGTGLYLGTHPLFQGTEPAFLGFNYDNNLIAQLTAGNPDHLSLAADRAARAIGLWQLQSMPPADAVQFLARKLWWWLAHHPASLQVHGTELRKLRLFEIASVLLALLLIARVYWRGGLPSIAARLPEPTLATKARLASALFVLLMFGALLVQLLPILYNSRYSTALLDPWLILLTAFALSYLTASLTGTLSRQSWSLQTRGQVSVLGVLMAPVVIVLATSLVFNYAKRHEVVRIDRPAETEPLFSLPAEGISVLDLRPAGEHRWVMEQDVAVLSLDLRPADLTAIQAARPEAAMWRLGLTIARQRGKCRMSDVAYQLQDGAILPASAVVLPADGKPHTTYVHANRALRPTEPGRLRIVFKCPAGTTISWSETTLVRSTHAVAAVQHVKSP